MPLFALPAVLGGIAAGGGAVASGLIGAGAAGNASRTQANAALTAQQLQAQSQAQSLAEQQREFNTTQANEAPFIGAGQNAINYLDRNAAALSAPYSGPAFTAPTLAEARQAPGYQFALDTGSQALASRAAAQGTLLSGQTGEALQEFGQQLGQQDYQQVFNNALTAHQQAYNEYNQNQANTFNRYASLAGIGQQSAGQLATVGQNNANAISSIFQNGANAQSQLGQNAAAARASGYVGGANALSGIPSDLALSLQQIIAAQQQNRNGWGSVTDSQTELIPSDSMFLGTGAN